ncbi:MAG TPA: hypothetical protein VEW92_03565 [Nitrososphaeraceae archaeon]|nr:hypothetical protein [Nitrososphaeraceae archaeon]
MIHKQNYVCITCGRGFTRRTSGKRHNLNLHSGMSEIVESSLYYIGIIQGKYPTPDPSTPFKTIVCYNSDLNHSSHLNIGGKSTFHDFFRDNTAHIDKVIEKYYDKLKPFLGREEINKFVQEWIICPITSTFITNIDQFNKHTKIVDNVVGYIRMSKRLGDKIELIIPKIDFKEFKQNSRQCHISS